MSIRILVVDDAPFIRDMLRKQLRDHIANLEIKEATDGAKALAFLKNWWPDIVLSDWEMPNMTGEELLKEVREMPNGVKLPFIMVTTRGDREYVVKAVQSGVSDYITKPFTIEELLRKVNKQLKLIGKGQLVSQSKIAAGQNIAFSSLDVLTNGRSTDISLTTNQSLVASSPSNLQPPSLTEVKTIPRGKVHLQIAGTQFPDCPIRDITIQSITCNLSRTDTIPCLFDEVDMSVTTNDGEVITRLKGFIQMLQAAESRQDTRAIKIIIKFAETDSQALQPLAKFIAGFNS